jgi:glycosidase
MAKRPKSQLVKDPLWYKDAVIYQLHVKSFFDANDDGVGDFAGLNAKLDYIDSLGVNAVWLLPFYPSPRKDDGYDIAGYRDISQDYGTLAEFKDFVAAAHARGIRVITELVINHTSDQHPWFQRARKSPQGSAEHQLLQGTAGRRRAAVPDQVGGDNARAQRAKRGRNRRPRQGASGGTMKEHNQVAHWGCFHQSNDVTLTA